MNTLRPISWSLLFACIACAPEPDDPPAAEGSETTVAADASAGPGGSATSTMDGSTATATGTASDPSTSAGTADETGLVFLAMPDGGTCVFEGVPDGFQLRCSRCDLAAQDCPRGEKCMPWANDGGDNWNATRCSPVPDDAADVGEPCVAEGSPVSGIDDCALGLSCFGVDPRTLQGTCTALCSGDDPEACGDDAVCVDWSYGFFSPNVCLPRCDPTDPAACPRGEHCRSIGADPLCVPTVTLPEGIDCGVEDQHCAPEEACVSDEVVTRCEHAECCTPWCDLTAAAPDLPCSAAPGEVCQPFFDAPPPGYEHVGVCGLPR